LEALWLTAYEGWSEANYCAGFMDPAEQTVSEFLRTVEGYEIYEDEDYKLEFLAQLRKIKGVGV
jgi:hypothetical protein